MDNNLPILEFFDDDMPNLHMFFSNGKRNLVDLMFVNNWGLINA